MILELFIVFLAICFILIFLGFYTQIKVTALIGFTGLFLLGMLLQAGHVTQQTGYTETNTYICTICGTPATSVTECVGTPDSCVDHASIGICSLYGGCTWNGTECIGTPSACTIYDVREDCLLNGCEYNTTITNGTTGINESALATTTSINNYTSITDNTSKWLGRWLAIMSILAFILVIISNGAKK